MTALVLITFQQLGITLAIVLAVGAVIWVRFFSLPTLQIPGSRLPSTALANSTATASRALRRSKLPLPINHDLTFVTEDVRAITVSETNWELHIFFTIYNHVQSELILYDLHAEQYCDQSPTDYQLSAAGRVHVTLYSDNSILQDGRVDHIPPSVSLSIDLGLQMSAGHASIFYAFGLFADCHYALSGIVTKKRYPSDSIYVVTIPKIQFVAINEQYAEQKLADHHINRHTRRLVIKMLDYLQSHKARVDLI
jgi:hypothetical protein